MIEIIKINQLDITIIGISFFVIPTNSPIDVSISNGKVKKIKLSYIKKEKVGFIVFFISRYSKFSIQYLGLGSFQRNFAAKNRRTTISDIPTMDAVRGSKYFRTKKQTNAPDIDAQA